MLKALSGMEVKHKQTISFFECNDLVVLIWILKVLMKINLPLDLLFPIVHSDFKLLHIVV